jgi:molybdopterin molybdotransferase
MLSVAEARRLILAQCRPLPGELLPLGPDALGRVLAETVAADVDMPPFDKAAMDGYAVRAADLPSGKGVLTVIEEVRAGQTPRHSLQPGQACNIMTGAPVPEGADAVVVVEHTKAHGDRVEIDSRPPQPGQNIIPRGKEMRLGEAILPAGSVLRPQALGLLAVVGRAAALQVPRPRVAVLATGDELIDPPAAPGPGQIRNSNAPMLLAQAARAGGEPLALGIARDNSESLTLGISEGLRKADLLVLSGGVSAGKADIVPGILQQQGVVSHFHKVEMKPGKPLFFGTHEDAGSRRLVFGLPGNPVSSLVCFELFLRPAVHRLAGLPDWDVGPVQASLKADFRYRTDRPTYHPARLELTAQGWRVEPVSWFGSSDLRPFLGANALVVLAAGDHLYQAGQSLDAIRLDA